MKLLLMRHGETSWNTQGRLQGQTDIPLNEEGRRMAVSCGQGMKEVPVDLCVSSPLIRAVETAEPVLKANAFYGKRSLLTSEMIRKEKGDVWAEEVRKVEKNGLLYYTDDRLKEASFGPWEGLVCKAEGYSVPLADFSTYWNDPESSTIREGVERLPHVAERVERAIRDLTSMECLQDKTVLLVVHGCVMRSVMYLLNGKKGFRGKVPLNCEVMETEPDGNGNLREVGRRIYSDPSMVHDYYATMKQE